MKKGAGDSFVGALAHYISFLGKDSMCRAIELASEYASLSVTSINWNILLIRCSVLINLLNCFHFI